MISKKQESVTYTKKSMLFRFLKGSKTFFIISILASSAVAGLDMVIPQVIRVVVDYCLDNNPDSLPGFVLSFLEKCGGRSYLMSHLYLAAAAVLAVALLNAVFQYVNTYFNTKGAEKMMKTARDLLFSHIQHLPYSWHMHNDTGDIIQRCTTDINVVRDFVSEQLIQVIRIVILIGFSIVCMASMSWKLTGIVLLSIPIVVGYSYFFFFKVGGLYQQCDENEGVLSTIAQENLTGVRVVRAFGRENYERERFGRQNKIYTDTWMKLCRYLSVFWAVGDIVMGLQLLLIVVLGTVFCVRGGLTAGELIAFISYNSRLVWPVRRLGRVISEMSKAGVSLDRLRYILNSEAETDEKVQDGPALTGDITFSHVNFAYEASKPILKDVSFTIKGGTTLGILGGTGSGKTTLIHLLNRLYESQSGKITIDGIPVTEIPLGWLRSHIGMVLQEPYLFSRTIQKNIAITRETAAPMEEIRHAARVACIDDSIMNFAKGYDTMVGERGVTLSGGQKQRTAIARMLMQNTPIMIFDDSLSAVDAETDEKIRQELKSYMGQVTMILISHRISTLMDADQIIVMDQGRILQSGTHEELVAKPGFYRDIYEIQNPKEESTYGRE